MNKLLNISRLSIGYRKHNNETVVASNLNGHLLSGTFTCLLGRNGAGKSTLLRTLAGFQQPLEGEIAICGQPMTEMQPREIARAVSVVLTEQPAAAAITVEELVAMGRSPYTDFFGSLTPADREAVAAALALTGVSHLAKKHIYAISDGERQKVMIAKALAQDTPVIFLDEPTAFLDFPAKVEIMALLKRIATEQERAVFMSTHDLQLAFAMAHSLWLLSHGGELVIGSPKSLAENGEIARNFNTENIVFRSETMSFQLK